jgi:hypothetical protein
MRDQAPPSNERRAAATARSTSADAVDATRAIERPSTGLTQSKVSPETAST